MIMLSLNCSYMWFKQTVLHLDNASGADQTFFWSPIMQLSLCLSFSGPGVSLVMPSQLHCELALVHVISTDGKDSALFLSSFNQLVPSDNLSVRETQNQSLYVYLYLFLYFHLIILEGKTANGNFPNIVFL